ncbi:MAG TPA: zinc ribbon domain-containing protein [Pyrinomonadaceae bacterium]|nr:zinc ribbon domain-containing protein [Pyrinomonadaceae bacterium]
MHCPNCGMQSASEQKFCRACGLNLEKVAQTLAEQLPTLSPTLPASGSSAELVERQKKIERWIAGLCATAGAAFILFIIYGIVYKVMMVKGKVFEGALFLFLIVGLVTALLLVMYREHLREQAAKAATPQTPSLPQSETTAKLLEEARVQPFASVTERTTELLAADKRRNTGEV